METKSSICIVCEQAYSQHKKFDITDKMNSIKHQLKQRYPSTCLICIQKELAKEKQHYTSNLKTCTKKLKQAHKAYLKASIKKQQLCARYQSLDTQQAYIDFFLNKPVKTLKIKRKKKAVPTISEQTKLINTLLAQLSPEQQASITKSIKQL